jgi:hypothetical protein
VKALTAMAATIVEIRRSITQMNSNCAQQTDLPISGGEPLLDVLRNLTVAPETWLVGQI